MAPGRKYVLVPHRWLSVWRNFIAGRCDAPDPQLLSIESLKPRHEADSNAALHNTASPWVPPPYMIEFLEGHEASRAVIPVYGLPGKPSKSGLLFCSSVGTPVAVSNIFGCHCDVQESGARAT